MSADEMETLRLEYRQILGIIMDVARQQESHKSLAASNADAIADLRGSLEGLHQRLLAHMDDEEGKIERTTDTLKELRDSVDALRALIGPQHCEDHAFIAVQVKAAEERAEFWKDMRRHIARWSLIGILGLLGAWLFDGFTDWLAEYMRGR
jgi:hypothetical protein